MNVCGAKATALESPMSEAKKNRGKASHRVAHHDRFPRRIAIDDLSQMLTRALNVFGNAGETGVILRLLKIFHKDSIGLETFS